MFHPFVCLFVHRHTTQSKTVPKIAVIHLLETFDPYEEEVSWRDTPFTLAHVACAGDVGAMVAHIQQAQQAPATPEAVAAIALVGVSRWLSLGQERVVHQDAARLFGEIESADALATEPSAADESAKPKTPPVIPLVDGSGILPLLERWGVRLVQELDTTIWAQKRVLMVPGLNHVGLADGLEQHTAEIHYADPFIYFSLPTAPGVGSAETLQPAARRTLPQLREMAYQELFPLAEEPLKPQPKGGRLFAWADVLAGDVNLILRHAPMDLSGKTIVVPALSATAVDALRTRKAAGVVTLLPPLTDELDGLAGHDTAVIEALLVTQHGQTENPTPLPLDETTYLNLLADVRWQPGYLELTPQPQNDLNFAFLLVPESSTELKQIFDWTSFLPDPLVEKFAAYLLPHHLSHMSNLGSPATKQMVSGLLFTLGVTPQELMRREPAFLTKRLVQAATLAERLGARLLGLDALPDMIFPAVDTAVAQINLPLSTGRTLGLVTTLNTAVAVQNEMTPRAQQHILVLSATSPLGECAAAWLAQTGLPLSLLGQEPDRLIMLKQKLEAVGARSPLNLITTAEPTLGQASLLVMPEPQPKLNWRACAPGAVVCDLVRPFAHPPEMWHSRPDMLVMQTTAVRLPGTPTLGYDFELFDGAIPPELAELILLSLVEENKGYKVQAVPELEEMHHAANLFALHQFQLAAGRSYQHNLTPEVIAEHRTLAQTLRDNPAKLAAWQGKTAQSPDEENDLQLPPSPTASTPPASKRKRILAATGLGALSAALIAAVAWWWKRRET